ncbi:MAG: hypothetical protein RL739_1612 [Pseudomonadota bacterium]|jgi:uncharacterized membrane protein (DUF4010 family)
MDALIPAISSLENLGLALGIGLLIGAERERSNAALPSHIAGIRTFAISALAGAVAVTLDGAGIFPVVLIQLVLLIGIGYWRSSLLNPGVTTELALAVLLAAKKRTHDFAQNILSASEWKDLVLFTALILILYPLTPDVDMGPWKAINPHQLVRFVVLIMAIGALGHISSRHWGGHHGLALTGFAGGFVSSTATVYAMGKLSRDMPTQIHGAVMGAVLSSISTIIQLFLLINLILPQLVMVFSWPLLSGVMCAIVYATAMWSRAGPPLPVQEPLISAHLFEWKATLTLVGLVVAVMLLSAGMNQWLGQEGILITSAIAGLADAHAIVASMGSLLQSGQIAVDQAQWPIVAALLSNMVSKSWVAWHSGTAAYYMRVILGQLLVMTGILMVFVLTTA